MARAKPGLLDAVKDRITSLLSGPEAPVTVVSGLPRSGTSMMMQALDRGGLEPLTDHEREPDPDNPEGYYELERVKALPEGDVAWLDEARGRAVKVVSALLRHLPEGYTYDVVFMRRDIDEVLASQDRMLERRGEDDHADEDELRETFLDHLEEVQAWADARDDIRLTTVDYNAVVEDPEREFEAVRGFLRADLELAPMVEVVDPDLYRQRKTEADGSESEPSNQGKDD